MKAHVQSTVQTGYKSLFNKLIYINMWRNFKCDIDFKFNK